VKIFEEQLEVFFWGFHSVYNFFIDKKIHHFCKIKLEKKRERNYLWISMIFFWGSFFVWGRNWGKIYFQCNFN